MYNLERCFVVVATCDTKATEAAIGRVGARAKKGAVTATSLFRSAPLSFAYRHYCSLTCRKNGRQSRKISTSTREHQKSKSGHRVSERTSERGSQWRRYSSSEQATKRPEHLMIHTHTQYTMHCTFRAFSRRYIFYTYHFGQIKLYGTAEVHCAIRRTVGCWGRLLKWPFLLI